jgi:Domain of unknown function (DUF4868)
MNLFALTIYQDDPIKKIGLSSQLNQEVHRFLKIAFSHFLESYDEIIPFDARYKPEEREVLSIDEFIPMPDIVNAIRNPSAISDFEVQEAALYGIKSIFAGFYDSEQNLTVVFQAFDKRKILSNKNYSFTFNNNQYAKVIGSGITLDPTISATLCDGLLIFKSFSQMKRIFDMTEFYREATDRDLKQFATHSKVKIDSVQNFLDLSDSWVRRKISLITDSDILNKKGASTLKNKAKKFGIDIQVSKGKVVFPNSKKELKELLRFLDEDYYQSPITSNSWVANSKRSAV